VSVQRLGDKAIRRLERATGQDILRAWANGGYLLTFVATAHRHGWFDKKTEQWGWDQEPNHNSAATSCSPRRPRSDRRAEPAG
jgi:hypothetical protein